ncbi:MAG: CDP-alcohol phosphatidyltransferase family protein [Nanoarchaeota archaeon]
MNPNAITTFRLLALVLIILSDHAGLYALAVLFLLLGLFSDFLDGYVSRTFHQKTDFGAYYDHFVDKIFIHVLLMYYLTQGFLSFWIVSLIILRDYLVLGFRQYAISKQHHIPSIFSGKIKLAIQGILLLVIAVARINPSLSSWISPFGVVVVLWSYISLVDIFHQNKELTKSIKKEFSF